MVTAGTGETLPGPVACGVIVVVYGRRGRCCRSAAPYNRKTGSGLLAGRESEAVVVLVIRGEQNLRGGKGRCFVHARLGGCGR